MGPGELAHRVVAEIRGRARALRVAHGWAPSPREPVGPGLSLFPSEERRRDFSSELRAEEADLDRLADGWIDFFGHELLPVGNPVRWHRDPLTGIETPRGYGPGIGHRDEAEVGDVKFVWELGRHQHLIPLAAAYAAGGERRYRDAVVAQIEGWIDANPFARGIHWCVALEVALRLMSWCWVHSLLALRDGGMGLFDAVSDSDALGRSIFGQAWFVGHSLSRHSSANNHLVGELTALWMATQVFDLGVAGARWSRRARRGLESEALRQVHADGVSKEQALHYHLWVLEYLLVAHLLGQRAGEPLAEPVQQRIRAMARFLREVKPRGGEPPQIGDSDSGSASRFEPRGSAPYDDVLDVEAVLFEGARPRSSKGFWHGLAVGAPMASPGGTDEQRAYPRTYREGGYAILGSDRLHLVFRAGPLGYLSIAAHAHADALRVVLALDGAWWLVDPGTFTYSSRPVWRDYFRGTMAHNTAVVDGQDQSISGGPFLWMRHADARLEDVGCDSRSQWARGSHDGYRRLGVLHRREVRLDVDALQLDLEDEFEGSGAHHFSLQLHFAPEVSLVSGDAPGAWDVRHAGSPCRGRLELDPGWSWQCFSGCEEPIRGWYSPAFGKKVPCPMLQGSWCGMAPARVRTRLRFERT